MTGLIGVVARVNGPVVHARGSTQVRMGELVGVGEDHLVGEVIALNNENITIQVYEETAGLTPVVRFMDWRPPLWNWLRVCWGIFDGIQRPLPVIQAKFGDFINRGIQLPSLIGKRSGTLSRRCHWRSSSWGHHVWVRPGNSSGKHQDNAPT